MSKGLNLAFLGVNSLSPPWWHLMCNVSGRCIGSPSICAIPPLERIIVSSDVLNVSISPPLAIDPVSNSTPTSACEIAFPE